MGIFNFYRQKQVKPKINLITAFKEKNLNDHGLIFYLLIFRALANNYINTDKSKDNRHYHHRPTTVGQNSPRGTYGLRTTTPTKPAPLLIGTMDKTQKTKTKAGEVLPYTPKLNTFARIFL